MKIKDILKQNPKAQFIMTRKSKPELILQLKKALKPGKQKGYNPKTIV